ncbi:MAG: hypothetical protein IPK70_14635 [Flavobacteriales bacterium]|jgi:hypothetical protein|nr:hypothetical protein [Flavobacteriales bacterium]
MSESLQIVFAIIVITLVLLLMAGAMAGLMVVNSNRRVKHRLELEAEHRRLQQEVARAEREATQETMHQIGRELHDNVGQLLTVSLIGLRAAAGDSRGKGKLGAAVEALELGIEEVRRLAHSLSRELWLNRTLAEALAFEAARIERVVRIRAQVQLEGEPRTIDADTSTILYRIFQEVVNNALKHSRADALSITFRYGPPITLIVSDNGQGFDPDVTAGNGGLHTLRHRCELIGFSAHCFSAPDRGCTWTFAERSATVRSDLAKS